MKNVFVKNDEKELIDIMKNSSPYIIQYMVDSANGNNDKLIKTALRKNGNLIRFINHPDEEMKLIAVRKSPFAIMYIKNPSNDVKMEAIRKDPWVISIIKIPNKKMQMEAVCKDPYTLLSIKKSFKDVQVAAVTRVASLIKDINNPHPYTQMKAIMKNINLIKEIDNPCEEAILYAIQHGIDFTDLKNVINPSERVQIAAVKQVGINIKLFKPACEQVKYEAINSDPESIHYIDNPSDELKELALSRNHFLLADAKMNFSDDIIIKTLSKNPFMIKKISNPTEEMKLTAVKSNGLELKHILNPSDEIINAAINQNGCAIFFTKKLWADEKLLEIAINNNPDIRIIVDAIEKEPELADAIIRPGPHPFISTVSFELKLLAVSINSNDISYIEHPDPRLQYAAIKCNPLSIRHIKNPYLYVCQYAISRNPEAAKLINRK